MVPSLPAWAPDSSPQTSAEAWRDLIADRIKQHRARRRGAEDPDPNLNLQFPVPENSPSDSRIMRARRYVELAASRTWLSEDDVVDVPAGPSLGQGAERTVIETQQPSGAGERSFATTRGKQMEPALCPPPNHFREEALPAETSPFAAESQWPGGSSGLVQASLLPPPAEQLELLPNFEDIKLEAAHRRVLPELEAGLRPAALGQRLGAGALDLVIVLAAVGLFRLTFTRLSDENPHSRFALLCVLGIGAILWTLYQYLFLVHGRGTPGMYLAQLELATFEGRLVSPLNRRCRALASALSGFSLGLGFLWALIDEDHLGWHDRMTKTLLRSSPLRRRAIAQEANWGHPVL